MTGRLPLKCCSLAPVANSAKQRNLHCGLEQLVEAVHALDELQGDTRDEQLLELLNEEAAGLELHDDRGEETAPGDEHIEDIPAICFEAPET